MSKTNLKLQNETQISEFDSPTDIITHCPSVEIMFPFHLDAFLFDSPPSPAAAAESHKKFREKMHQMCGARVWTVREILSQVPPDELRNFIINYCPIKFEFPPIRDEIEDENPLPTDDDEIDGPTQSEEITEANAPLTSQGSVIRSVSELNIPSKPSDKREKMTTKYIKKSMSRLSTNELIDLILLNPSIEINVNEKVTGFEYNSIPIRPVSNLVFTRDQQIVTDQGVVIGRFTPQQRLPETLIMELVWKQFGIKVKKIVHPGTLEGGDFIPIDKSLSLLGVGFRTNKNGAKQLMENNWVGTDRFVIVQDKTDLNQERMHLDTIFNVLTKDVCICLGKVADNEGDYTRIAKEYEKVPVSDGKWKYVHKSTQNFGDWLKQNFKIILGCTSKQQNNYILNFINLGERDGKHQILAVNKDLKTMIHENKLDDKINIEIIDYSEITALYGGVHCSSQIFRSPISIWKQTTNHVLMVKPKQFEYNPETKDNKFAKENPELTKEEVHKRALNEFEEYVKLLKENGINVSVVEDTLEPFTPDSIFPNNCFSTIIKDDNQCVLNWYSMFSSNRRQEIPKLQKAIKELNFKFDLTYDLGSFKESNQFLEGTGSLVLDRMNRVAYCCLSNRTHENVIQEWCKQTGFESCLFHAFDSNNDIIYHTNVMMNVGTRFCIVCLDSVTDQNERNKLKEKLQQTHKIIVEITMEQMGQYAGNMLEVRNNVGEKILVMSQAAKNSLTESQIQLLETDVKILSVNIPIIEAIGGGSARCMLAEIFQVK